MPLPNSAAIKAIRQAKGWKGVDFAHAVGISSGHLFNLESVDRKKHVSAETLDRIARILSVPVEAVTYPEPVEIAVAIATELGNRQASVSTEAKQAA